MVRLSRQVCLLGGMFWAVTPQAHAEAQVKHTAVPFDSGSASADESDDKKDEDAKKDEEKKPDEPAAAAPAEEKKDDKDVKAANNNPRLAPGGVAVGGSSFPLHIQATLDNSFGSGFLSATNYQRQPQWSSALTLSPSAMIKVDPLPRMLLTSNINFLINNWLPAYTNGDVYDRIVRVSDVGIGLVLPGVYVEEWSGISVSPSVSARLPLSLSSRQNNLVISPAAAIQLMWNSPETPVGVFTVIYRPSVRGNLYHQDSPTVPCEAGAMSGGRVNNPLTDADLPLTYGRTVEVLDNGECRLRGRQTLFSLANSGTVAWSLDAHNVSLSVGHAMGFQRALKNAPELNSIHASGQSFTETSNASLSYSYTVPVDFIMYLTAGVASDQPVWTANGKFPRFPLYDFITPGNNFSSAFFDITVGL